jgi:muramoyltetrapeptide carboxypeptidase
MAPSALLAPGDLVHVVAPSGGFERGPFEAGLKLLEQAGLRVRVSDGVFARQRYFAGSDARRLAELEAALADPEVRALWTARGGYGAARLLPSLRPERVAAASKALVGFSDATALHALWTRAGLPSVHGANVTTLPTWTQAARDDLFSLLLAPTPHTYLGHPEPQPAPSTAGTVRGTLWGGNLTVLGSLCGTGALPRPERSIVMIEDVGERPYRLDRTFTQLRQSGALEGVVGVVVGQLTGCEEPSGEYGPLEGLREAMVGLEVPVLTGLALGHDPSSRAILLGVEAELDPSQGTLTVHPR